MTRISNKQAEAYLGDGAYACHDGFQVWLYTSSGDEVALEPGVMMRFLEYCARLGYVVKPVEPATPPAASAADESEIW